MTERDAARIALTGAAAIADAMRSARVDAQIADFAELAVFAYLMIAAGVDSRVVADRVDVPAHRVRDAARHIADLADLVPGFSAALLPHEDQIARLSKCATTSAAQVLQ